MRGMILAAGLGTRLKPLTRYFPKPFLPVLGKPMIRHTLDLLKKGGIRNVIVNLHHLPKDLRLYLQAQKDMAVSFSLERQLLGTGGGIAKARPFFKKEPFVVINSDMLMDIDLKKVIQFHKTKGGLATMVVKRHPSKTSARRYESIGLSFDHQIVRYKSVRAPRSTAKIQTFFTGIHIFEPSIFDFFPKRKKFCIIDDVYAALIKHGVPTYGYLYEKRWEDLGSLALYLAYHKKHLSKKAWDHFKERLLKLSPGIIFPNSAG